MPHALRFAAALAAVALSVPFAAPADAEGVQVGTLTCNSSGSVGFVFGSTTELGCTFSAPGRIEHYTGQISKFGVDIGYTRGGVLFWTVFAPTGQLRPHDLAGTYGGATAGATVGVGGSVNALIGGNGNTISLQPVSFQGNTGLNIAAGVASMTLTPAP
jgi:uncharacterized protein DUF992